LIRRFLISILALLTFSLSEAQYISEVVEYTPAPGQLINVAPWGTPDGSRSMEGGVNGSVCLGAFGGYVVFRFEHPVENDPQNPFGVDFTIFGNPMPEWSEAGVVWVMKDENENGEADDSWYELAGSDFWFSSTQKEYSVTYTNPGVDMAADVPWEDQWGTSGVVRANSVHTQPYYPLHDSFPAIAKESYTLDGTLLQGLVYEHPTGIRSIRRAFGYADNQLRGTAPYTIPDNPYTVELENAGGDAFDIGWAVNSNGEYVELDRIHFIKVQSGILADGGLLGELSTELTGAVDVSPEPSITGETEMVVIQDLPPLLEVGEYQLDVFTFQNGHVESDRSLVWTTSHPGATVDESRMLRVREEGPLTITAALSDRPEIYASVSTRVQLNQTNVPGDTGLNAEPVLYPNPASDYFRVQGTRNSSLLLFDASGKELIRVDHYQEESVLDIRTFPQGIYLVQIEQGDSKKWFKLIKQ
jgi:hypothetical protein